MEPIASTTDMMGRTVQLHSGRPMRIVSLVPSQTELVATLLEGQNRLGELVGITKFCIHPKHVFKTVARIGGTKTVDAEKVQALSPTLTLANKEENTKADIEQLEAIAPVWVSDILTVKHSLDMIRRVGELLATPAEAEAIATQIELSFEQLPNLGGLSCLYLIWRKPFMAAGTGTFIGDILNRWGALNVATNGRYPEMSIKQITAIAPQLILLSSEPYPFADKHIAELQVRCPKAKIMLVDGELFSWYGNRLLGTATYLQKLSGILTQA